MMWLARTRSAHNRLFKIEIWSCILDSVGQFSIFFVLISWHEQTTYYGALCTDLTYIEVLMNVGEWVAYSM